MTVKNILVAYDGHEPAEAALRLAVRIAREHDAHLTGLLTQPLPMYPLPEAAWLPVEVMDTVVQRVKDHAVSVGNRFVEACAAEGMGDRVSFHAVEGPADARFAEFARTYDLVVIGQPKGDFWEPLNEPDPGEVAQRCGRPVLVAPRQLRDEAMRNGSLVAWDGGRAGARALADALSTVMGTGKLTVLHVGDEDAEVRRPGRDVMEHLSRHGIHAELLVLPRGNRPIAQVVLDIADASGAGLLVMGAYEHSRLGEALLGGVTRDVLRQARLPVLVAH